MIKAEIQPVICHATGETKLFIRIHTGPGAAFSTYIPVAAAKFQELLQAWIAALNYQDPRPTATITTI